MVADYLTLKELPKVDFDDPTPPLPPLKNHGDGGGSNLPRKPAKWWQAFLANGFAILVSYGAGTTQQNLIKQPIVVAEPSYVAIPKPPKHGWGVLDLN
jgi:hypothetical protein